MQSSWCRPRCLPAHPTASGTRTLCKMASTPRQKTRNPGCLQTPVQCWSHACTSSLAAHCLQPFLRVLLLLVRADVVRGTVEPVADKFSADAALNR